MLINACHPERSEGSGSTEGEILRGVYPERSEGLRMTAARPFSDEVNTWTTRVIADYKHVGDDVKT